MKILLLVSLTLISLNTFSAELGEEQKSPCPFANQSPKRDAKQIEIEKDGNTDSASAEEVKTMSK